MASLEITALCDIGEVSPKDDLAELIASAADSAGVPLQDGDVVVVTQKIVSKAEGRIVDVPEGGRAELALAEAARVLRRRGDLLITQTRQGLVCANSGVDCSNVADGQAVLLPADPDRSARRIRNALAATGGVDVAVVISDTFGRAWRTGLTDVAIGVAGILPLLDLRGSTDTVGRELAATEVAVADELASAADLVLGKTSGCPAALIRGYDGPRGDGAASELIRAAGEDLFR